MILLPRTDKVPWIRNTFLFILQQSYLLHPKPDEITIGYEFAVDGQAVILTDRRKEPITHKKK